MLLYAQPYNIDAIGFFFSTYDEYQRLSADAIDRYGDCIEEFEIQMVDGTRLEVEFFAALACDQSNIKRFYELIAASSPYDLMRYVIALREGLDVDLIDVNSVIIYEVSTLAELAEQFVLNKVYGEISDQLLGYIDYQKLARDLACQGYRCDNVNNHDIVYTLE